MTYSLINAFHKNLVEKVQSLDVPVDSIVAAGPALESDDALINSDLEAIRSDFSGVLTSVEESMALENDAEVFRLDPVQREVAIASFQLGNNIDGVLRDKLVKPAIESDTEHSLDIPEGEGGFNTRSHALESYDPAPDPTLATKTVTYNVNAVRPAEFVRELFPFVVFNANQLGVAVNIDLLYRHADARHKIDGSRLQDDRRFLTQAGIDNTILRDDSTRVIPVVLPDNATHYVDPAVIPNWTREQEGESIDTNFLKFAQDHNLIGLSQSPALLRNNVMTTTDQLDRRNVIGSIAYQVGGDILELDTFAVDSAAFTNATTGSNEEQRLSLTTTLLQLNARSTARGGAAFTDPALVSIGTSNLRVRLAITVNGKLNVNTGTLTVYHNQFAVHSVSDSSGLVLDSADPAVVALTTAIDTGTALGFTIRSHRSNTNRRQRGRLINHTRYTREIGVAIRSPMSVIRPTGGRNTDTVDVAALTYATHKEMGNEAIRTIFEQAQALRPMDNDVTRLEDHQGFLGLGSFYMHPRLLEAGIDLPTQINSIKSHERHSDTRAAIVMRVRDMSAELYRNSAMRDAQEFLYPGQNHKPIVKILTDSRIAPFLTRSNGESLLGERFDSKVVVCDEYDVRGKVILLLGDQSGPTNEINPLGVGNCLYAPEILTNMVIDRNGETSKEVTVMRHYRMILNSNLMGILHVRGISEVLGQLCVCDGGGVNPASDTSNNIPTPVTVTSHW